MRIHHLNCDHTGRKINPARRRQRQAQGAVTLNRAHCPHQLARSQG